MTLDDALLLGENPERLQRELDESETRLIVERQSGGREAAYLSHIDHWE